eukprot:4194810-Amphidinium_carterae.1
MLAIEENLMEWDIAPQSGCTHSYYGTTEGRLSATTAHNSTLTEKRSVVNKDLEARAFASQRQ